MPGQYYFLVFGDALPQSSVVTVNAIAAERSTGFGAILTLRHCESYRVCWRAIYSSWQLIEAVLYNLATEKWTVKKRSFLAWPPFCCSSPA